MDQNIKTEQDSAENKIIKAARSIFHRRGFDGARMQEIADEAGINKALLHYYYRSKDRLFQAVFEEAISRFFPLVLHMINSEAPLEQKIEKLIHTYIDFIKNNRFIPGFVLHEMTTNPERMRRIFEERGIVPKLDVIKRQIREGIEDGRYIPIEPEQLLLSILSQCVFPFVAKPMVEFFFSMDEKQFNEFIERRKAQVTMLVLNGLRV
ncbi:TetR/AcrR family transcriptional regulator [bacterium]|nr:TetR/AcrR family transcriptional regulator [bacterium]NUN44940.1 TetR/AcrR family transcriptional regulator [bacterium]HMV26911.1 TetR/AcrR family transcriptional regulator [bacterium]HMW33213.1 TetR/AcrR family transcriptional regulator [bacterium]HMW35064.1 TetR/AcrR family transcriptional regulator [bacterium]